MMHLFEGTLRRSGCHHAADHYVDFMAHIQAKAHDKHAKTNGRGPKSSGRTRPPPEAMQAAYNAFKEFEGKRYTGMKVGRGHKWIYEAGEWTERKITPDKWEIRYTTPKRRKGKAPEGSGVPVGTAYHWYILAHQTVQKLDANSYSTDLVGVKYKLSHKRADKETWSASEQAQRRRLIQILQQMIADLQSGQAEPTSAATPRTKTAPAKTRAARKPSHKPMRSERRIAA
ncbi:MAG TPA: hypothetical protein VGP93_14015 [Polyangiaceae bacterium]|jgi:hypothetical protein|nr:hypothetical protein [Polyangiaceae bacterium]